MEDDSQPRIDPVNFWSGSGWRDGSKNFEIRRPPPPPLHLWCWTSLRRSNSALLLLLLNHTSACVVVFRRRREFLSQKSFFYFSVFFPPVSSIFIFVVYGRAVMRGTQYEGKYTRVRLRLLPIYTLARNDTTSRVGSELKVSVYSADEIMS